MISLKKNLYFAFLPLLLMFGAAPVEARDLTARDAVNAQHSFWAPFSLFEDSFRASSIGSSSGLTMYEDDKHLVVQANLPGLDTNDVEVTYDRGVLSIKGERRLQEEDDQRNYYHKSASVYAYNVDIPQKINESKNPKADFKNGLMTITFEKSEAAKPKKIQIN